jgi:hypothetical protein
MKLTGMSIIVLAILIPACNSFSPQSEPEETVREAIIPAASSPYPLPTYTPFPTHTPYPTYTPAPTPRTKTIYRQTMCRDELTDNFKMEYDDIQTISSRLQSYVAGLPDVKRISYTYRTSVWNNADSKLHGVMYTSKADGNQYAMQFLVYVNELGFKPATFYIDEQCWLDAP